MSAGVARAGGPPVLPPLREEIALNPGPAALDGSPTWTLHDPARNQFYRVDWRSFEILSRWDAGDAAKLIERLRRETPLDADVEDIQDVARFLSASSLIVNHSPEGTRVLLAKAAAAKQHWASWLFKNYLFLRVPLVRPDRWLGRVYPRIAWVYTAGFRGAMIALALLAIYLVARQWDEFTRTFNYLFSIEGAVYFALALTAMKVVHELGHAFTAKRYGCRVPRMGVAMLVMWPVLYTDVTESWKLPSRRQRLAIGVAGVSAEMICAVFATLAWSFLADGPLRSAAYIIATSTWVSTLLINLSPFMRFDGYFVLSDWLEMPNLHARAFAVTRWWLREMLFGLNEPPPEDFSPGRRRFLIVFSFATWIYRVAIFAGIALIVYHFAVKALGIAMGVAEIGYFLVRPVWMEARALWRLRGRLRFGPRPMATLAAVAGIVLLLLLPWRTAVDAPSLLKSAQVASVFAPDYGARIVSLQARNGRAVAKGAVLVVFASPDLAHKLGQAKSDLTLIEWQLSVQGVSPELQARSRVAAHEYEAALATYRGLANETAKLEIAAPVAGRVTDIADDLRPGQWVALHERLMDVIDPDDATIEAYVSEADLTRIVSGARAKFYPERGWGEPIAAHVTRIGRANVRLLTEPYLASRFGGAVPVRELRQAEWVPEGAVYRVMLAPDARSPAPGRVLRGEVVIDGAAQSLALRAWRRILAVAVRESGL